MAEALLRKHGGDRFEVHSAGTDPKGINPLTLRVLAEAGHRRRVGALEVGRRVPRPAVRLRHHRLRPGPPGLPVFPGVQESLHWGYEDPAEATGTEEERLAVFRRVFIQIGERIRQFATVTRRQPV